MPDSRARGGRIQSRRTTPDYQEGTPVIETSGFSEGFVPPSASLAPPPPADSTLVRINRAKDRHMGGLTERQRTSVEIRRLQDELRIERERFDRYRIEAQDLVRRADIVEAANKGLLDQVARQRASLSRAHTTIEQLENRADMATAERPFTHPRPWRVGGHFPIHVYQGDTPVATFHTMMDAAIAVRAHNGASC